MAKKKASTALAPVKPAATLQTLDVRLEHSEHWPAIQAFRDRATKIVIGDKASCEGALRTVEEGKELERKRAASWKPVKQGIDRVKRAVLDLEQAEEAALAAGLDPLEQRCVDWKRADDARVEREARIQREANEAAARKDRERELKAQEKAAAKLEAESPHLSARELWFVEKVFEQEIDLDSAAEVDLTAMSLICKQAGYEDGRTYAARLAASKKIRDAIAIKREVVAKREQAAALREQPILAATPKVESQVAKTSGTRFTKTYTLGAIDDVAKFIAAYKAGDLPDEAMVPNEVHLRRMAKDLEDKFEQAYPGCTVKVLEGVAG